jgi:hypothetical protein
VTLAEALALLLPAVIEQAVKLIKAHEEGKLSEGEVLFELEKIRAHAAAHDAVIAARIDAAG